MALTLGRAGIDVDLTSPASWNPKGDEVTFDVVVSPDDNADKQYLVEQLVGLVGSVDTPVVPVTWDAWPAVDGFYRDLDLDLSMVGASLAGAPWRLRGRMRRMAGFSSPLVESRLLHRLRDGSPVAAGTATGLVGVPGAATTYGRPSTSAVGVSNLDSRSVRLADGTAGTVAVDTWASNTDQADATWRIAAADFYQGACQIDRLIGGDQSRAILGRQVPGDVDPATGWILSNGLLYIAPAEAFGGTTGRLILACWAGAAYESATELSIRTDETGGGGGSPDEVTGFVGFSILRNGPEATVARLLVTTAVGSILTVDLGLRRGDRLLTGSIAATDFITDIGPTSGSYTSLTGGYRLTSNDADGNRLVTTSATGLTADGRAQTPGDNEVLDFGFGHEVGGSGATGIDTAQALANQYATVTSERARLVLP